MDGFLFGCFSRHTSLWGSISYFFGLILLCRYILVLYNIIIIGCHLMDYGTSFFYVCAHIYIYIICIQILLDSLGDFEGSFEFLYGIIRGEFILYGFCW